MNKESRILAALISDRNFYDSVKGVLSGDDFSDKIKLIVQLVTEYYTADPDATTVRKDWLIDAVREREWSVKLVEVIEQLIEELPSISIPNAMEEYKEHRRYVLGRRLSTEIESGGKDVAELMEQYRSVDALGATTNSLDDEIRLDEALVEVAPENLIRVSPKSLNDRLGGGLVPGCQVAVYAPTEVGKTQVSINMAAAMLKDGHTVLYCGNEDSRKMLLRRFFSRMSGMAITEMLANEEYATKKAYSNGIGNLRLAALDPGTIADIEYRIKLYKPAVVFIDQMANLTASKNLSKVEKCEFLACELRSLAQRHKVVNIVVHQASDSANGKLILDKSDMYFSNVGVQGQMDVMIGIGMDQSFHDCHQRMLCLTKNKLSGNHTSWPVRVKEHLSLVEDV